MTSIEVQPATTPRDRRAFVTFPWRVYRDDPNWVPPLISERLDYLDPAHGPFYAHADVALFLARQDGQVAGTIGACVDHRLVEQTGQAEGGFGFFEVLDDPAVSGRLLDAACTWLGARGMTRLVGPASFTDNDCPGVLVEPTDCPPAMLEAHNPLYYQILLEGYGLRKSYDLYAWRASRQQIGEGLANIPPQLLRVAEVARQVANVSIRTVRLDDWDQELATIQRLHQATLPNLFQRASLTEAEFRRLAGQIRPFLDPDLALIAEVVGELRVHAPVDHAAQLFGIDLEVVLLDGHAQGHGAQLAGVLLPVPLSVVGQPAGHTVNGLLDFRDPEVPGAELDHFPYLLSQAKGC